MAKITLQDVASGYNLPALYNANNAALREALDKALYRTGEAPNQMEALLDMNSNPIINLPYAILGHSPVTLNQFEDLLSEFGMPTHAVVVTDPQVNQFLQYDGTVWVNTGGAAGNDTEVQYNDDGVLSGHAGFTYNHTGRIITVGGDAAGQAGEIAIREGNAGQTLNLKKFVGVGAEISTTDATWLDIVIDGTLLVEFNEDGIDLLSNPEGNIARPKFYTIDAVLGATEHNYNASISGTLMLTPETGGSTITGILGGVRGYIRYLYNRSDTHSITLAHESASSTAAARFHLLNGSNLVIPPRSGVTLIYDSVTSRWRAVGTTLTTGALVDDYVTRTTFQTVTGAKNWTQPQQFATIELGHASDTTLSRIAAGRVAIEGGEVAKLDASQPFTALQEIQANANTHLRLFRQGAPADQGMWGWQINSGGDFLLQALSDAGATGQVAMLITRGSGSDVAAVSLRANNRQVFFTQPDNVAPATTGAQARHADGALYDVGMNLMPIVAFDASTTLSRTRVGHVMMHTGATARTWTTPASTDTSIPSGSMINGINNGSGNITIAAGSGVTLRFFNGTGAPGTGSRTAAPGAVWSMYRRSTTEWYIWGNGGVS